MKIKAGLKIRTIADENVLILQENSVEIDTTKVVSFNETAKWLWDELREKDFSLNDIIQLLINRYNIDAVTAERDAEAWINRLAACNALEESQPVSEGDISE